MQAQSVVTRAIMAKKPPVRARDTHKKELPLHSVRQFTRHNTQRQPFFPKNSAPVSEDTA